MHAASLEEDSLATSSVHAASLEEDSLATSYVYTCFIAGGKLQCSVYSCEESPLPTVHVLSTYAPFLEESPLAVVFRLLM